MKYDCRLECTEWENLSLLELLREVKECRLIEISLENWLAVRQWKDIPIMWEADDWAVFHMEYGMLYCTHWQDIISVWHRWDDLKEWLDICGEYI